VAERTYAPDSDPVELSADGLLDARATQHADRAALGKEMSVRLDHEGSGVTVDHRITNRGAERVVLAPWALTIMRGGGVAIIPQEPFRSHSDDKLPARPFVLWSFTDLSDPRLTLGPRFIRLTTDESRAEPQKIGVLNKQQWCAYQLGSTLFVKRFPFRAGADYPDYNCNNEVYTAAAFIELESLGPLVRLEPGASVEHHERWQLFGDVAQGSSDDDVQRILDPIVASTHV
jgi:hypothetical protein